jgi:hypothetical protein
MSYTGSDTIRFDLVSRFTVFTSILDPHLKHAMANETLRVLRPEGRILRFGVRVNNPNNCQVRDIAAAEIRSRFAGFDIQITSALLAPLIVRQVAGWSQKT